MLRRRHLYFLTRGNADGAPYIDVRLRPNELQAIGRVTAQWALLEFVILRETRGLARYLNIPLPADAEKVSFRRRRQTWEDLSSRALATLDEEKRRALDCIERAKNLADERHRITHNIIEYDPDDDNRLKAFLPETLGKFGWPLDAARIEQTAREIARLTHDVLYCSRRISANRRQARSAQSSCGCIRYSGSSSSQSPRTEAPAITGIDPNSRCRVFVTVHPRRNVSTI
jgi:hypothetical protein